jgi:hypothetical protein
MIISDNYLWVSLEGLNAPFQSSLKEIFCYEIPVAETSGIGHLEVSVPKFEKSNHNKWILANMTTAKGHKIREKKNYLLNLHVLHPVVKHSNYFDWLKLQTKFEHVFQYQQSLS